MKSETANIQPRSRRRSGHPSGSAADLAMHDPRTRVLIRVPWLKPASEAKAVPPVTVVAEPTPPTILPFAVASPPPMESQPPLPRTAPPSRDPRAAFRIDAPHATAPAPHSASPAWSRRGDSWLKRLPAQPLVWITAIISTAVVVVVLIRTGDRGNSKPNKTAPTNNSAKREIKSPEHEAPPDRAAEQKPSRDDRMALRDNSTKTKKPPREAKPTNARPTSSASRSTMPTEESGLNRRAGMNEPARNSEWMPPVSTSNSGGSANLPDSTPFGEFKVIDGPSIVPPAMQSVPSSPPSNTFENNRYPAAAGFTGSVEHLDHTIKR